MDANLNLLDGTKITVHTKSDITNILHTIEIDNKTCYFYGYTEITKEEYENPNTTKFLSIPNEISKKCEIVNKNKIENYLVRIRFGIYTDVKNNYRYMFTLNENYTLNQYFNKIEYIEKSDIISSIVLYTTDYFSHCLIMDLIKAAFGIDEYKESYVTEYYNSNIKVGKENLDDMLNHFVVLSKNKSNTFEENVTNFIDKFKDIINIEKYKYHFNI